MMGTDELRALCTALRHGGGAQTDNGLVDRIRSDVDECRALHEARPEQAPFAPLDEPLPLMGWLIYEAA